MTNKAEEAINYVSKAKALWPEANPTQEQTDRMIAAARGLPRKPQGFAAVPKALHLDASSKGGKQKALANGR